MRVFVGIAVVLLFALSTPMGQAQEAPTLEAFLGYSHVSVSPANGGLGDFGLNGGSVQGTLNFTKWISGVADIGANATSRQQSNTVGIDIHGTMTSYLFGPRLSYRRWSRVTPFAQGFLGAAHASAGVFNTASSQTRFAFAAGGGIDFQLKEHIALRPIAIDYLRTRFDEQGNGTQTQNNIRYSTGVVFRF